MGWWCGVAGMPECQACHVPACTHSCHSWAKPQQTLTLPEGHA